MHSNREAPIGVWEIGGRLPRSNEVYTALITAVIPGYTQAVNEERLNMLRRYLKQQDYSFRQSGDAFFIASADASFFNVRLIAQRFGQNHMGVRRRPNDCITVQELWP